MTLPFTRTLRGYYKVINWSNFNTVLSQGIGRHKDRKRDEGPSGLVEQSEHTQQLSIRFAVSYGPVHGAPKQAQW